MQLCKNISYLTMTTQNRICSRSVLDSTIPGIQFDENGECQFCKIYDELETIFPLDEKTEFRLNKLISEIKLAGKNKKYDCIIGVSGGTDSMYTLYQAIKLGLRPLAVHFDNGWNSKIAVKNIKNACDKLKVELYTYVVDWEEFKDLQISFLKASTSDAEIPTDVAIHSTLIKTAAKENIKYILNGHSFRTEFLMPLSWTYMDAKYIRSVQKIFGTKKLKTFPNFSMFNMLWFNIIKGIKVVPFLNYFDYNKQKVKPILESELGWEYTGGHHHESVYTKFFQSYLLPKKFNIDKRKTELTAMILSKHITREQALKELENNPYAYEQETVDYTINKLGLNKTEFDNIFNLPVKTFHNYPTSYPFIIAMKPFAKIAVKLNLVPRLLYLKFYT